MKVTVSIIETTYGSIEIEVPNGMSNEEIAELAEQMVDDDEVEIEYGDEIYREYNV